MNAVATPAPAHDVGETITVGNVVLHAAERFLLVNDKAVAITGAEHQVLRHLMQHAGQLVTRQGLEHALYGNSPFGAPASNVLQVYIGRLRKKLEAVGVDAIQTVWGTGYRYELPKAGDA